MTDADDWKGGKALMWNGNVYKDPASGGILGFIHMEFSDPRPVRPRSLVSACAARTLNATGQSRVTLSLQKEHLKSSPWAMPGGKQPNIRPNTAGSQARS